MRYLRLALIPIFLAAAALSFLHAYAESLFRSATPSNIAKAARLVPWNYHYQLAIGNHARALQLNPYSLDALFALASDAETRSDFPTAENYLLRAAQVDRRFRPRWALANFYFRRNNKPEFWKWLRRASQMSYPDRTALFQLATRATDNPHEIIQFGLDTTPVLHDFLRFQLAQNALPAAWAAAQPFLQSPPPETLPDLATLCDRLLENNELDHSVQLWNSIHPERRIDLSAANLLANPSLTFSPLNSGFDWRLLYLPGVESHHSARRIRIELTGKQPEQTPLLTAIVPIPHPGQYSFRFRYRTESLTKSSGLRWTIDGLPPTGDSLYAADWKIATLTFIPPPAKRLIKLTLRYDRELGTSRPAGIIELEGNFAFSPLRSPPS